MPPESKLLRLPASLSVSDLEKIAIKNVDSYLDCGAALYLLNERGYWRDKHSAFADYVQSLDARFADFTTSYIYRLVRQIRTIAQPEGDPSLPSENVSSPAKLLLGTLDDDTRDLVVENLDGKSVVTSNTVAKAIHEVTGKGEEEVGDQPYRKPKQPNEKPPVKKKIPACDSLGQVLPENLISIFSRVPELKELYAEVERVRLKIESKVESEDGLYRHIRKQQLDTDLNNAKRAIKFALPYAICPYCKGSKCEKCGGAGWMPKDMLKLIPDNERS